MEGAAAAGAGGFALAVAGGRFAGAGPGSGLSEEPTTGVRSAALDVRVAPECPPGPARSLFLVAASAASCRWTTSDSRRRRQRSASRVVLPSASFRW